MLPAAQAHQLKKIFTYGRRSYAVRVDIPMCALHFGSVCRKGTAEKLVGRLGVIFGTLAALFATLILQGRWDGTEQGNTLLHLLARSGAVLGISLIIWATISLWLAPFFAKPASKAARRAVRFTHYWPKDQFVRLKFQNEELAEIVRNTY